MLNLWQALGFELSVYHGFKLWDGPTVLSAPGQFKVTVKMKRGENNINNWKIFLQVDNIHILFSAPNSILTWVYMASGCCVGDGSDYTRDVNSLTASVWGSLAKREEEAWTRTSLMRWFPLLVSVAHTHNTPDRQKNTSTWWNPRSFSFFIGMLYLNKVTTSQNSANAVSRQTTNITVVTKLHVIYTIRFTSKHTYVGMSQ